MPNWVVNNVYLNGNKNEVQSILDLICCKENEENYDDVIDFNHVIPMPQSMQVVSGGWSNEYIAVYVKSLPKEEQVAVIEDLQKARCRFYGNYYNKYIDAFTKEINADRLERMHKNFQEDYKELQPKSIEDIGKAYIDNIRNYGVDTWYDWSVKNWGTKWNASNGCISDDRFSFDTAWSAAIPITLKLSEMYPSIVFTHEFADEDIGMNCGRVVMEDGDIIEEYYPEGPEAVSFANQLWGIEEETYTSLDEAIANKESEATLEDTDTQIENEPSR